MKKFLFVMPLMAISLLASCGGSKSPDYITHKFTFHGTNCMINGASEYSHDIYENDKNVQYTITPNIGYKLPETIDSNIPYDNKTGVITISEIKADIELRVEAILDPSPVSTYTLTFSCENCKAFDENDKEVTSVVVTVPESEHVIYQKFYFKGVNIHEAPFKSGIVVKKTGTDELVDFEYINGKAIIPIVGNLSISASGSEFGKTLEEATWSEISDISSTGHPEKFFSIGNTKTISVNGKDHQVRIIGFNHDVDANDDKIGITFDFVNPICDQNGYSIATQWNDTNDDSIANHNYLDSSIRKALTGKGGGHILWAQRGNAYWSNQNGDYFKDKTVIDMLPGELVKVLRAPKKSVLCKTDGGWIPTEIKSGNNYDELFVLSSEEISGTESEAYAYYFNGGELKKFQISEETTSPPPPYIPQDAGQDYKNVVSNFAGFKPADVASTLYWLRSPDTDFDNQVKYVDNSGSLANCEVHAAAHSIAPAFCI